MGDENPIRTIRAPRREQRGTSSIRHHQKHGLISRTYSENSFIMVLTYGFKFKSSTIMSTAPPRWALTTQQ
nr:hypothetical protein [Tanacetum cinerariifolium]